MWSYCSRRSVSKSRMLEDASNSAGLRRRGSRGQDETGLKEYGERVIACSQRVLPVARYRGRCAGPSKESCARWAAGRFSSTSSTRTPFCASTMAVFMLVVVLPSCGRALVMSLMILGRSHPI